MDSSSAARPEPSGDIRADSARYYDLAPHCPDDLGFYRGLVPSAESAVLELGCGTGRVIVPMTESCAFAYGIDSSDSMLEICRQRLREKAVPSERAAVELGDICDFDLGREFDLIVAPFRVLQNVESDERISSMFECIRRHLKPDATCVLNVFRPYADAETLRREWQAGPEEFFRFEAPTARGRVVCSERWDRIDADRMILYPTLVYREYAGDEIVNESELRIAMKCYYPDGFLSLIEGHGFRVVRTWGGYAGEVYGEGPELIVQFAKDGV